MRLSFPHPLLTCSGHAEVSPYRRSGQPDEVVNPARGQLNRKNEYFPVCPRSLLRFGSRETRLAVPSSVSLSFSKLRLNLVLTHGITPELRSGVLSVFYY